MTEQSRAECEYRQRAPFALLIPFSSSTLFHPQENWDAPMQGKRASALSNWAALFPPAQHDSEDRNHFLSALFTKHTNHSLCTKHTITVRMTPPQCRHSRLARVHPRMGARLRPRPDFRTACRRCEGRACQVCHVSSYEQLRAFTSSYERLQAVTSVCERVRARQVAFSRVWSRLVALLFLCSSICMHLRAFASVCERVRARQVAFSRVWSRLVAFSRAYFFSCSGTFGRVLSSFLVILRHSSSFFVPK